MDRLWTPWRYAYVSKTQPSTGCIFCEKAELGDDERNLVIYRADRNYVLLNLYPYNNGHVMVAPYQHAGSLQEVPEETVTEMMRLGRMLERVFGEVYRPKGINLGMNLGACAGAGVAGHIHMHVLPRWPGDVSFMTSVGETRVVPEDLETTWKKLKEAFERLYG